jgi:hypothetical protein
MLFRSWNFGITLRIYTSKGSLSFSQYRSQKLCSVTQNFCETDQAGDLNFCDTGRPISTFDPRLSRSWNLGITLRIYMSKASLSFSPSQCWSQKLCLAARNFCETDWAADLNFCDTGRPNSTFDPRLSRSWNLKITLRIYMSKGAPSFSPSQCWSQKLCSAARNFCETDWAADLNFCDTGRPISTFAPRLARSWNFGITLRIYMSKGAPSFSPRRCWSQKLCLVAHSAI